MIAVALFSLTMTAAICSHLFGMRMFNVAATKLNESFSARGALNHVQDDIRECRLLYVGNGDENAFTNVTAANPRLGNAVQIYPTSGTNIFIRYYVDSSEQTLNRITNGQADPEVVATSLTNLLVFQAEDFVGNIVTNDLNNRVVAMTLQYSQWEMPAGSATGQDLCGEYYLQARMTRRAVK